MSAANDERADAYIKLVNGGADHETAESYSRRIGAMRPCEFVDGVTGRVEIYFQPHPEFLEGPHV